MNRACRDRDISDFEFGNLCEYGVHPQASALSDQVV